MATFEIFPHLDAIGRQGWPGNEEERPLTDIGWKQAEKIADELLAEGPVHGVFASDNTRCHQSLEHLARRAGLEIGAIRGFQVPSRPNGETANPLDPAYQAGSTYADLLRIQAGNPDGRFVICSNGGDIITSLMAFVAGTNGLPIPPKLEVSIGPAGADLRRGNIYTVILDGNKATFKQRVASADFPQAIPSRV
jgi:Histidine phosphatase superfamily (branch 1)